MSRQDKQSEEDRAEREDEDTRESDEAAEPEEGDGAKADEESSDDGESDEAAERVAAALGVAKEGKEGDGEGEAEEASAADEDDEKKEAAKPNRAARRREEALARRKKRTGSASAKGEDEDDASLPKDKNARAKELLKRRREQAAAAEKRPVASALDAGEMVDDALARSTSAVTKWLKANLQAIQWVILVGLVAGGGYLFYASRSDKKAGDASAKLAAGIAADRGVVMEEDKRSDEQKEVDPTRVFKTAAERDDAAINAFAQVVDQHGGTGAALLAKLGQAGAYLDKKEYDKAIEAYTFVLNSALAAADPDVKGRATEGIGFAKEGKGDLDGALASFKQLSGIDVKGYKELATYHEARVLFAKGEKDKAKELLKPLDEKLQLPSQEPQPTEYLKTLVHDLLTQIDPTTPSAAPQFGGGGMPTPQMLQDMARKAQENAQKKAAGQPAGGTP